MHRGFQPRYMFFNIYHNIYHNMYHITLHIAAWYMLWYMSTKHIPYRKPFVYRRFGGVMVYGYMFLLFLLIDDLVGSAGDVECLGMIVDERIDVAYALLFENLVNGNQDARLFNVAKAVVDGGAEEFHGG